MTLRCAGGGRRCRQHSAAADAGRLTTSNNHHHHHHHFVVGGASHHGSTTKRQFCSGHEESAPPVEGEGQAAADTLPRRRFRAHCQPREAAPAPVTELDGVYCGGQIGIPLRLTLKLSPYCLKRRARGVERSGRASRHGNGGVGSLDRRHRQTPPHLLHTRARLAHPPDDAAPRGRRGVRLLNLVLPAVLLDEADGSLLAAHRGVGITFRSEDDTQSSFFVRRMSLASRTPWIASARRSAGRPWTSSP